ncbi:MAG: SGNH/GDSL hydrolase family protein [Colwellia sp.]|uniref:SGNH/GDSL hydrolase family protein n=1 Tax=Colwellia sp. TaxID=56799 RepID=UPI0025B94772|nr:SGNH/GDSL hydrolase family protein [Colwellia sp.]NQZ28664.1 SGNH/GDSL hydrolase family protein [Colwellia sp.]
MKVVLCYGDSNTYGYVPGTGARYPFEKRWTGVLQKQLGCDVRVIEQGLSGRTTIVDDPARADKNGATFLPQCLESHSPVDVLVLMLGTNDILQQSSATVQDASRGVSKLIDLMTATCLRLDLPVPQVLLVAPPLLSEQKTEERVEQRTENSAENKLTSSIQAVKTHDFSEQYRAIANEQQCAFLDAAQLVSASNIDGIHLDEDAHQKLGVEIARMADEML